MKRVLTISGLFLVILFVPFHIRAEIARYNSGITDYALAMAIDSFSGNVYVTGFCAGSPRSDDYLTVAYDPNGNELWATRTKIGEPGSNCDVTAIAIGPAGRVFVSGFSTGSGTGIDYTTIAYDSNGNQLWLAKYNCPSNKSDKATAMAIGRNGLYVTGYSFGKSNFDYLTIRYK